MLIYPPLSRIFFFIPAEIFDFDYALPHLIAITIYLLWYFVRGEKCLPVFKLNLPDCLSTVQSVTVKTSQHDEVLFFITSVVSSKKKLDTIIAEWDLDTGPQCIEQGCEMLPSCLWKQLEWLFVLWKKKSVL